ncbi:histone arginine demethylase [Achlya hypogyna]|uniref:Histone arginine demethylase n=1 Tax=Achlya hypogyna TaxID=1202772 RepID=A0A1V9ZFB0_ACHHY|nr:histone arginine demethylase [Achlya hypogyna]
MALASLSDELKVYLTLLLEPRDLLALGATAKVWYVFCAEEPLWEAQVLREHGGDFVYGGSWKTTHFYPRSEPPPRPMPPAIAVPPSSLSSDFLFRRYCRRHMHLVDFVPEAPRDIPRLRADALAPVDFLARFGRRPVMLLGACDSWPAFPAAGERRPAAWTLETLALRFGDVSCRITHNLEVDASVELTLADYQAYVAGQHDETPLYIFDPHFGDKMPSLLDDYEVPAVFAHDLLGVLDDAKRPEFRWLVAGPARSGAPWHLDPVQTSAWNSLFVGRKRWALYPPHHPPPGVRLEDGEAAVNMTSLEWYLNVYPTLRPEEQPYEVVQEPGETIYVPSGWWHLVLNLDFSVAVTQNFVDANNVTRFLQDILHDGDVSTLDLIEPAVASSLPSLAPYLQLQRLPTTRGFVNEVAMVDGFADTSAWAPAVQQVLRRHGLLEEAQASAVTSAAPPLRPATAAVNPVFVVHNHAVVKWFSPLNRQWADCDLPTALAPHFQRGGEGISVVAFLESAYENEVAVYAAIREYGSTALRKATPALLGHGRLHPIIDADADVVWRWPYVVLSYAPDEVSLESMLSRGDGLQPACWTNLVNWLGNVWFPAFHALPVPDVPSVVGPTSRASMQWYIEYLQRLRNKCVAVHVEAALLPDHLLDSLDAFLPEVVDSLVLATTPVFLHGDLTNENILGRIPWSVALAKVDGLPRAVAAQLAAYGEQRGLTSLAALATDVPEADAAALGLTWELRFRLLQAAQRQTVQATSFLFADEEVEGEKEPVHVGNGQWAPSTVIDFADMKTGDPLWDLIPLAFSLLHGDMQLLGALLATPHWRRLVEPHRPRLPQVLLSLTLLHPSLSVAAMLDYFPAVATAGSWADVATAVFGSLA